MKKHIPTKVPVDMLFMWPIPRSDHDPCGMITDKYVMPYGDSEMYPNEYYDLKGILALLNWEKGEDAVTAVAAARLNGLGYSDKEIARLRRIYGFLAKLMAVDVPENEISGKNAFANMRYNELMMTQFVLPHMGDTQCFCSEDSPDYDSFYDNIIKAFVDNIEYTHKKGDR